MLVSTYRYTLSMSRKIKETWGKKYVPSEAATLVFVCQIRKIQEIIKSSLSVIDKINMWQGFKIKF